MLITGGALILDTNRSISFVYIVLGAVVAGSSVSHPHFERACSARQPDISSKSLFCATYHANSSLNCARIANVCRMRQVCEKTRVGRNNCELIGSKPTSQSRVISQ